MRRTQASNPRERAPAPSPPRHDQPGDDWSRQPPWCALTESDDELARIAIRTCN
ncbi:MAG TPA: hypothetical protein VM662_13190 [Sphingomonas sp.]|nr:hypothetical protein [Sphingomonas sp.]